MADDQQNPFTMMGMMNMMKPNPYEGALYKNKPLSLQGFRGPATDARGNVIPSFADAQARHDAWDAEHPAPTPAQGTTLNTPGQLGGMMSPQAQAAFQDQMQRTTTADTGGFGGTQRYTAYNPVFQQAAPQSQAAAAQPTNPVDMRQAYLDALANPGHVGTPGATIPPSQPVGTPSVMDSFLAQNKGSSGGAGGYSNQGFFDTLNKLRTA